MKLQGCKLGNRARRVGSYSVGVNKQLWAHKDMLALAKLQIVST